MDHNVYIELKKLPSFSLLNEKVKSVELQSSWWERYGWEWTHNAGGVATAVVGLLLLRSGGYLDVVVGFLLLGASNVILTQRAGHLAAHGALADSKSWNRFWFTFFIEFLGHYSQHMADYIHIKIHHPHTNIIGLGDSSTWKVPSLPRIPYMFFAPILTPPLTPLIGIQQLIETSQYKELPKFLLVMLSGVAFNVALFIYICGYTLPGALLASWIVPGIFSVPYIHINIFQHIGLPMYSQKDRPTRIYQMSTGVLNLERNPVLDLTFGHSLISCHVEHHLFPRFGDNMCLKIKPLVKSYLLENGLPYHEKSYWDRLVTFLGKYDELMVKAPPITHFIGLQ